MLHNPLEISVKAQEKLMNTKIVVINSEFIDFKT